MERLVGSGVSDAEGSVDRLWKSECRRGYHSAPVFRPAEAVTQRYSCNDALEEPRHDYDLTWSMIVRLENRSRYI